MQLSGLRKKIVLRKQNVDDWPAIQILALAGEPVVFKSACELVVFAVDKLIKCVGVNRNTQGPHCLLEDRLRPKPKLFKLY